MKRINDLFTSFVIALQIFFARFYFNDHKFVIDYAIYTTRDKCIEIRSSMDVDESLGYTIVSRIWKSLYVGFEFALYGYNYKHDVANDTTSRSWVFLFIHVSLVRMKCSVVEFKDGTVAAYVPGKRYIPIMHKDGRTVSHLKKVRS